MRYYQQYGNGNITWLNLGLGMGMNHREWEGMEWKKIIPAHLYLGCTCPCISLATPLSLSRERIFSRYDTVHHHHHQRKDYRGV